jgi:hypothetical protein
MGARFPRRKPRPQRLFAALIGTLLPLQAHFGENPVDYGSPAD